MLIPSCYNVFDSLCVPPASYFRFRTPLYSSSYALPSSAILTLKTLAACSFLPSPAFPPLPHASFDRPPPSSHSPASLAALLPYPPPFLRASGFDRCLFAPFRRLTQQTSESLHGAAKGCAIVFASDNRSDCGDGDGVNDANDASGDANRCESDCDHDGSDGRRNGFGCVRAKCARKALCGAAVWKCSCHFRWNRWSRSELPFENGPFPFVWALLAAV